MINKNIIKGMEEENFIVELIKKEKKGVYEIIQKHTHGIDIKIKDKEKGFKRTIEVKSCKNRLKSGRKGQFHFYIENIGKCDFYAFIINYDTSKITYFVRDIEVKKYFSKSKSKTKVSMSIHALINNIKKCDFSEVLE